MPGVSSDRNNLCPVDRPADLHQETSETGNQDGSSRGDRMTDPDVPTWVEFTTRLRAVADELGQQSEAAWLMQHAADMICKAEDRIARLTEAVTVA